MKELTAGGILSHFDLPFTPGKAAITQLRQAEGGDPYRVWRIEAEGISCILKEAKAYEAEAYQTLLKGITGSVPAIYQTAVIGDGAYLLMEYVRGDDLRKCSRPALTLALDALISIQKGTWGSKAYANSGYSFDRSLVERRKRGEYLNDAELEAAYAKFLEVYAAVPRTLCHDDLLPFNILVSDDRAVLIDWEYAGILPYPTSFARLIAHGEEAEDALFHMTRADREYAIEYYYDNLLKGMGIPYLWWRETLEYFLLYEYCEWVMVGNQYKSTQGGYYQKYLPIAKRQAHSILSGVGAHPRVSARLDGG